MIPAISWSTRSIDLLRPRDDRIPSFNSRLELGGEGSLDLLRLNKSMSSDPVGEDFLIAWMD